MEDFHPEPCQLEFFSRQVYNLPSLSAWADVNFHFLSLVLCGAKPRKQDGILLNVKCLVTMDPLKQGSPTLAT